MALKDNYGANQKKHSSLRAIASLAISGHYSQKRSVESKYYLKYVSLSSDYFVFYRTDSQIKNHFYS